MGCYDRKGESPRSRRVAESQSLRVSGGRQSHPLRLCHSEPLRLLSGHRTSGTVCAMAPELILFVGMQASGKSTYYANHFAATHVHVSKDLMTNVSNRDARQQKMIETALAAGQSVVVDNTNPTPLARAPLIALGRKHGARVIAYSSKRRSRTPSR